jgi:hypothetical protein
MKIERFAPAIDFKPNTDSVDDQKPVGSCVAHAGQTLLEIVYTRASATRIDLSRMFIYYYIQKYAQTLGTVDGGRPAHLGKILKEHGVCNEATWPYDMALLGQEPSAEARAEARAFIPEDATEFKQLDMRGVRQALNRGQPVVFGMLMHESLAKLKGDNWREHDWDTDEATIGMHAVCCIGYDDTSERFLCENSWGSSWADGGFFGIPYAYFGAKSVLQAFTFTRLPVPFVPVPEYQPEGPATFDVATGVIELPGVSYYAGNVGSVYVQGVKLKLKDPGHISIDGPRYTGTDTNYYVAKGSRGDRLLGFPSVFIGDTEYKKVLLVNPDFSIESLA